MRKLLLFFCLCFSIYSNAQTKTIATDSALSTFREYYPQEKVFAQTDKDFYFQGETIYIKAWCTLENAPTYLSRIVYVDLVNANGQVVLKHMYKLDSLSSTGADFDLPETIASGNYSINAYSLWMLNFPEYIFSKNIFIYGKDYQGKGASKKITTPSLSVQFFPEGGNIIAGVSNRIAFKATDANGFPANIKGQVTDKSGKKIAELKTEHDGMGTFELDVNLSTEYTAIVTAVGTNSMTFKLPSAQKDGVTLKVENSNPNKLFVLLNRTESGKEKYNTVKIVASLNYAQVFSQELNIDNGETACAISKKSLPAGILHITLFDKNNLPLAERLAFIENYSITSPQLILEQKDIKAKAKNQVSFEIPNIKTPSLSVLITSYSIADSMIRFKENIASALLATTDLKGYIHNAGYYFKDKNPVTLHDLDLLLMTQGWRRYNWEKIQRNEFTALKYPVESAISFRGSLYKSDSKEPVTDGKVSFIVKGIDSTSILGEAKLTDKGEFLFNNVHFIKSASVSYMGTNAKKENAIVDVKLLPNYIDSLNVSFNRPTINLDTISGKESVLNKILNTNVEELASARVKTLATVTVNAKRLTPLDSLNKKYAGGPFLLGKGVDPSEFKNYRTVWQMIQSAVPGVTVEGNPFDPVVTFSRFAAFGGGSSSTNVSESSSGDLSQSVVMETGGIAYFLNEINVTKDIINTLSVDDIALIKVLKNEAAALGASQGAIAIYTKTDVATSGKIYDKRYTNQKFAGYSISKEYYQPDYSSNPQSTEQDNRYTLYWNSKLVPAKDNKYRFQFYNNSIGSKMHVLVQGIDKNGNLILGEKIIE